MARRGATKQSSWIAILPAGRTLRAPRDDTLAPLLWVILNRLNCRGKGARWEASGQLVKICSDYANRRVVGATDLWQTSGVMTILTPVDFSGVTDSVVGQAVVIAKALNARIVLLNVLQPPVITSEYGPFMENIGEIVMVGEKAVAKQLARLQEKLVADGLEVESLQFTGAPVPNILKQAEKVGANFIVMGSHGHTAFYDLLVGSTTHGVLLRSPCPVIIVPAQKKRKEKARRAA